MITITDKDRHIALELMKGRHVRCTCESCQQATAFMLAASLMAERKQAQGYKKALEGIRTVADSRGPDNSSNSFARAHCFLVADKALS